MLKFIEYNLLNHKKLQIFNVSDSQTLSIDELISIFSKMNRSISKNIRLNKFILSFLKKIPILKNILNPLTSDFIIETIYDDTISKVKLKPTKEI